MKKIFIIFSLLIYLIFLIGCATPPQKVFPVSQTISKDRSCEDYEKLLSNLNDQEEELLLHQKSLYQNDSTYLGLSIGLGIFVWPLAFFALGIKGDDLKTNQLAKVRGEIEEVNKILKDNCSN